MTVLSCEQVAGLLSTAFRNAEREVSERIGPIPLVVTDPVTGEDRVVPSPPTTANVRAFARLERRHWEQALNDWLPGGALAQFRERRPAIFGGPFSTDAELPPELPEGRLADLPDGSDAAAALVLVGCRMAGGFGLGSPFGATAPVVPEPESPPQQLGSTGVPAMEVVEFTPPPSAPPPAVAPPPPLEEDMPFADVLRTVTDTVGAAAEAAPAVVNTLQQLGVVDIPAPTGTVPIGGGAFAPQTPGTQVAAAIPVSTLAGIPTAAPATFDPNQGIAGQLFDALAPGGGGAGCATFRRTVSQVQGGTAARARAVRFIRARNPVTQEEETWEHRGKPILYTGDVAAMRRVIRAHKKLTRAIPGVTCTTRRRATRRRGRR